MRGSPLDGSPRRQVRRLVSAWRGQSLNWGGWEGSSGKNTLDWHCAMAWEPTRPRCRGLGGFCTEEKPDHKKT